MKINAYILAADPAWIEASVMSYYDIVDRIVVSYDRDSIGWNGKPLPVEECLVRLRAIDRDAKMHFAPGSYHNPEVTARDNETYQRQCAVNLAGNDADWVLQLDTDELVGCPDIFCSCLQEADRRNFGGIDYPARWLYQYVGNHWFLERSNRFWRVAASFPGPLAVRAGTTLRGARQCDVDLFRVDFRNSNTDFCRSPDTPVHRVIRLREGVIHYAWIRSQASMNVKLANHSDLGRQSAEPKYAKWVWSGQHPILSVLRTPILRRRWGRPFLRLSRIAPLNSYAAMELGEDNVLLSTAGQEKKLGGPTLTYKAAQ